MKQKLFFALSFLALASTVNAQSQKFEGTITYDMHTPYMGEVDIPMTINLKGGNVMMALDLGAMGGMKTYVDRVKEKVFVVLDVSRSGFEIQIPKTDQNAIAPELKTTGKKETINGYKCDEYTCDLDE